MKNDDGDIVVYGSFNELYVVFLEKSIAEYYSEIHRCYKEGITFGELHKSYPWLLNLIMNERTLFLGLIIDLPDAEKHKCDEYFYLLFDRFYNSDLGQDLFVDNNSMMSMNSLRQIYESELDPHDRLPLKDEVLNEEYLGGLDLLAIMNYEPGMEWVPSEIKNRFGKLESTVLDAIVFNFEIPDTENIVKAFEELGYICVRDDLLIPKAYGQT